MLGKLRAHIHVRREQNKGEYNWRGSSYKSVNLEMRHFFMQGRLCRYIKRLMLWNCPPEGLNLVSMSYPQSGTPYS